MSKTMSLNTKFKSLIDLKSLPTDLSISTMTIICDFGNVEFYLENISKYIDLNPNGILSIKYGDSLDCNRSLIPEKKKRKPTKSFYNQSTVKIMTPDGSKPGKIINCKLFKNGSIQVTGCKCVDHFFDALTILCKELLIKKRIIKKNDGFKMIKKYYINTTDNESVNIKMNINKIKNFKIVMINSNFKMNFKIDREVLYDILINKKIECSYEPCTHACVNIKYIYKNRKKISIFVFESGAIIITGANNSTHIIEAYFFINELLKKNYQKILLQDATKFINHPEIQNIIMGKNVPLSKYKIN